MWGVRERRIYNNTKIVGLRNWNHSVTIIWDEVREGIGKRSGVQLYTCGVWDVSRCPSGNCEKRVENESNKNCQIMCNLKGFRDGWQTLGKAMVFFLYTINLVEHGALGDRVRQSQRCWRWAESFTGTQRLRDKGKEATIASMIIKGKFQPSEILLWKQTF